MNAVILNIFLWFYKIARLNFYTRSKWIWVQYDSVLDTMILEEVNRLIKQFVVIIMLCLFGVTAVYTLYIYNKAKGIRASFKE